jgi:peptidyl-prolyl cis-trans isomerase SurA
MCNALRLLVALFCAPLPCGWGTASAVDFGRTPVDRIVAVVNDDVILQSELDEGMRMLKARLAEQNAPMPPDEVLRGRLLQKLTLDQLQLQLAEQTGVRVDDETLNEAIRQIAKDNNLTLAQFRQIIEAEGFRFTKFREDLRKEIIINRLRKQQVNDRIRVTDQEIDSVLATAGEQMVQTENTQYRLRHILIALPEAALPAQIQAARDKAERVLAKLRGGTNFGEAAIEFSDGQQALEGGDLGWRGLDQLPTLFADVVAKMRPGDVSDLIQSPSGFHIIQLADVKGGTTRHVVRQTRVRHILIKTNEMVSDSDARERLSQLKIRLEAGEEFGPLARAHSDDKPSAIEGGDLGWVSPGDMVPQFEEVMNGLAVGETSEPFHTEFGWHVVQVVDRREHDSTADFRRAQARELLRRRKIEEEVALWLRRLRDEAYVETRL